MDTKGARHLRDRIAQQQHWALAEAVRDGRQPATDPDAEQLEELCEGLRLYRAEATTAIVAGRVTTVHQRLQKTLVEGVWKTSIVTDRAGGH
jgi:hypothetical protein